MTQATTTTTRTRTRTRTWVLVLVLALVLAVLATPVSHANAQGCAVNLGALRRGRCVPYFGACSSIVGNAVWLADGLSLNDTEINAKGSYDAAAQSRAVLGEGCFRRTETIICSAIYYPCFNATNSTGGIEGVPQPPCLSACQQYWSTDSNIGGCGGALSLAYTQLYGNTAEGKQDPNTTTIPQCGAGASFPVILTPDTYGGRSNPSMLRWPAGLNGQEVFPPDGAIIPYRLADNRTIVNTTCYYPTLPLTEVDIPALVAAQGINGTLLTNSGAARSKCKAPLVEVNGACELPCPYPIWSPSELLAIQACFYVPGIIAFVINVFVLVDALLVVMGSAGWQCGRFYDLYLKPASRTGNTGTNKDSSAQSPRVVGVGAETNSPRGGTTMIMSAAAAPTASAEPTSGGKSRPSPIRMTTIYALAGSSLCIIYFIIGPLPTVVRGSLASCDPADLYVDDLDFVNGQADKYTPWAKATTASPFVLQLIFNLVFYTLSRMIMIVSPAFRKLDYSIQRVVKLALAAFCFAYPICCLAAGMALEKLSTDIPTAHQQLARGAAVPSLRVDVVTDFVLVSLPLILTGALIVMQSLYVFTVLRDTQQKVSTLKRKTDQDDAVMDLIRRLAFLGIFTFVIVVVYLVCSGVRIAQVANWSAPFVRFFTCSNLAFLCDACEDERAAADAVRPPPITFALQSLSISLIPLLFGMFFGAQSFLRLWRRGLRTWFHSSSAPSVGGKVDSSTAGQPGAAAAAYMQKGDTAVSTVPGS